MATEKRYIDANDLLSAIDEYMGNVYGCPLNEVAEFQSASNDTKVIYAVEGLYEATEIIDEQPTVDAVEVADMKEFAEDVVRQFGYYCHKGGRLHITHGGLSTLEWAFDILGWENPHPVPECECEIDGCHEHATCGIPTADGYKRVCGKHWAKMDGDGNE